MKMECATMEVSERTALITVNFPPANALAPEVRDALQAAMEEALSREDIWTVIITAAGDKFFMAGASIPSLLTLDRTQALERARKARKFLEVIAEGDKPVIAAINGMCLGGGLELALCCDIRIAADHAQLGVPEVALGIMPGGGGTQRLPRIIGAGMARYLTYTGERIPAARAEEIGLVEKVVPAAELLPASRKVAGRINVQGPLGVRAAKKAISATLSLPLEKGLDLENELWAGLFDTRDKNEGIGAFLEKRRASFTAQ